MLTITTAKPKVQTMFIESGSWKQLLVDAYTQLNEGFRKKPSKLVEVALQARIDLLGLLIQQLVKMENDGGNMTIGYGELVKKLVSVKDLKQRTRHTKLTDAVLKMAETVKGSQEKAAYVDSSKVSYPTFYRKIMDMKESGELDKGFFVGKRGEDFFLGYDSETK